LLRQGINSYVATYEETCFDMICNKKIPDKLQELQSWNTVVGNTNVLWKLGLTGTVSTHQSPRYLSLHWHL